MCQHVFRKGRSISELFGVFTETAETIRLGIVSDEMPEEVHILISKYRTADCTHLAAWMFVGKVQRQLLRPVESNIAKLTSVLLAEVGEHVVVQIGGTEQLFGVAADRARELPGIVRYQVRCEIVVEERLVADNARVLFWVVSYRVFGK